MKKLLLAAFLLIAGLITSETVVAEQSTLQSKLKQNIKVPSAVLQEFATYKAINEAVHGITWGPETWSASKGKYLATFMYDDVRLCTYCFNSRGVIQGIVFH